MTLLYTLLETCATLTKQVANLELDKVAQVIEITKLKQRVRRRMHPNRGKIAKLDENEDVTLKEVDAEVAMDAYVQGRSEESQAKVYHLNLEHAEKVLSMHDTDEVEPAKVEEVIEVVTAAKLMTGVVTTAATTITTTHVPKASAPSRRRGVIIQDPVEATTASIIMYSEVKSKDKGKGILVEEPKPLKRQAQIEQDEAFARELEAELNANINWNDVVDQVKMKERQDNTVMRYQALQRKPVTEAHARKNMMRAAKKQRIDEETKELKTHLQIVANDDDDVYTKATPLALKVPFVDYQIHHTLLQDHQKPKNFLDDFLLNTLKVMFEKPNFEASIWGDERGRYGLEKVKSWRLSESCGVHILTLTTTQMILLVKKKYPLTRFTLEQMLNNVRLEVKE
nr:hypothetical protein [Tanacetum cinerariifolium]